MALEMTSSLHILYEDNHILAVNKSAPLLTQAVRSGVAEPAPSLEAMVRDHIRQRYGKPGNVYLGIPHRLDRPVSGVVVFARNSKAARRLAEQFQDRQVTKEYWAAVEGTPEPASGVWENWLVKVANEARADVGDKDTPGARFAKTRYRLLKSAGGQSVLEMIPETGRMHQLRLQSALAGWPVLGDALYGAKTPFGPEVELARDRIVALHARRLMILHPVKFEPLTFTAPLPGYWQETLLEFPPVVFKSLGGDLEPRSPISG